MKIGRRPDLGRTAYVRRLSAIPAGRSVGQALLHTLSTTPGCHQHTPACTMLYESIHSSVAELPFTQFCLVCDTPSSVTIYIYIAVPYRSYLYRTWPQYTTTYILVQCSTMYCLIRYAVHRYGFSAEFTEENGKVDITQQQVSSKILSSPQVGMSLSLLVCTDDSMHFSPEPGGVVLGVQLHVCLNI